MTKMMRCRRLLALGATALSAACGNEVLVPEIEAFSPSAGTVGTTIALQGRYFDRDGRGFPAPSGERPWQVYLMGPDRRYELAIQDATDHSLVVLVPDGARSGTLAIADTEGMIAESGARFEVMDHPIVRVVNDAQYDVVDLRFNGEQVLESGDVVESGAVSRVAVPTDRYRVEYALGEYASGGQRTLWASGAVRAVDAGELGTEVVVRIPALEPIQLLAVDQATTDWIAELRDVRGNDTAIRLRMYVDGAWAMFEGDTPTQQGQLVLEPIGPYARNVPFRLSAAGAVAKMGPPFESFDLENGPPHWRLLRYVRVPVP